MKVQILMNIKFSLYTVAQYLEYKRKQLWGLNKDFQFRSGLQADLHATEKICSWIF